MMNLQAYLIQRISALIMAPLVLVHLAVIVYAIQGGLTAEEILSRAKVDDFDAAASSHRYREYGSQAKKHQAAGHSPCQDV